LIQRVIFTVDLILPFTAEKAGALFRCGDLKLSRYPSLTTRPGYGVQEPLEASAALVAVERVAASLGIQPAVRLADEQHGRARPTVRRREHTAPLFHSGAEATRLCASDQSFKGAVGHSCDVSAKAGQTADGGPGRHAIIRRRRWA
jgi:hypothetical protein